MQGGAAPFLACALLGACQSAFVLDLPRAEQGTPRSAFLIVKPSGRPIAGVYALSTTVALPTIPLPADSEVDALLYADDLAALQLPHGLIHIAGPSDEGRKLPDNPLAQVMTALDGPDRGVWRPLSPADSLADVRLEVPPFDVGRCFDAGGCFASLEQGDVCTLPCPEPAPPQGPAPPDATCPSGWGSDVHDSDGFVLCRGVAPARPGRCPPGTFPRFGRADCRPIGRGCPSGDWAEDWAQFGTSVIYVKAGATLPPNGTKARPYASVQGAISAATSTGAGTGAGTVIAIAKGEYPGPLLVPTDRITLLGACTSSTTIGEVRLAGTGDRLARLHVRTSAPSVTGVDTFAPGIAIEETWIEGSEEALLVESSSTVSTSSVAATSSAGIALFVASGARANVVGFVADGFANAIACGGGPDKKTYLSISNALIQGPQAVGLQGTAFTMSACTATLARVLIRDRDGFGFFAQAASTIVFEDVIVKGVRPRGDFPDISRGVVFSDSDARITRLTVDDVPVCGVDAYATTVPRTIMVHGLSAAHVHAGPMSGSYGEGICVGKQVALTVDHAYFDTNDRGALSLNFEPAVTATVSDMFIQGSKISVPDYNLADVGSGASLYLHRALFHGGAGTVVSVNPDATFRASDLIIEGGTIGVHLRRAVGPVAIDRTSIKSVTEVGIQVGGDQTVVRDLQIDVVAGADARGLLIPRASGSTFSRFAISGVMGAAIDVENEIATSNTRPLLMDGDVSYSQTALFLNAPVMDKDLRRLMLRVRAHDNDRPRGQ